ncbi:MAG: CinA family protein [Actinobacteria bacterium]|nr:CinA family protein [Actinomycetota bacterium]
MTDAAVARASAVLDLLRERGLRLAVAESLTGGALSAALVAVPGASDVLDGAVVAYATPVKASVLGVDPALLSARGPVDAEVARQMALGARRAVAVEGRPSDIGVATTGVAGPTPQGGQPVGTVFVGVSSAGGESARAFRFDGDRAQIRAAAVEAALEAVLDVVGAPRPNGSDPGSRLRE